MIIEQESRELKTLNEIFIKSLDTLPSDIENSMMYPKIRNLLHPEINRFTREHREVREDLHILRMNVGETISEEEIREYLDGMKQKYNMEHHNIGLDYHIEATRFDYGVPVFLVIKRDIIYMKKFVFRFRKASPSVNIAGLSGAGMPVNENVQERRLTLRRRSDNNEF